MPTPITQTWELTIPIPHWILHLFHIKGGLLIKSHITISAHREVEEFNSFTLEIVFRWRSEGSLPPHLIEEVRIVFGYLWPNLYYHIEEDLIVCTPSRGSSVTGETSTGTTTPVDPQSPPQELHEVPLPPPTLLELLELPGISNFNRKTEALCQRVKAHNRRLRDLPLMPEGCLEALLARVWSRGNLDRVAFQEGHITYCQLWRIDQGANPHLYTKVSLQADADYQPPCFQDTSNQRAEEKEIEGEKEHPMPIPDPSGTHSEIPHLEHSFRERSSTSSRDLLDEHLGTIIEEMFWLPESDWFQKLKHCQCLIQDAS